jgi:hypothetical protein
MRFRRQRYGRTDSWTHVRLDASYEELIEKNAVPEKFQTESAGNARFVEA